MHISLEFWKVQEGAEWEVNPCWALLENVSPKARIGGKIGDSNSPFCLLTPSPKSTEGRSRGAPLDEAKEQRRKGRPEFLLPWKRILIQFLSSPVSSPSSLSSFGLQLSKTRLPALTLLSRRKTPQLQTQVKQIFVAASKFQRLFIVRLSAPGAKSCC